MDPSKMNAEGKQVGKFARKLACLLPLLLFVLGLNYWVDSAHLFGVREQERAAQWARGETLIFDQDENDRLLVRAKVGLLPAPPDVVVIGSSRALQIQAELFPGKTFFNTGVLGGTLPDALATYELLREHERLPKILVLVADPYLVEDRTLYTGIELRWLSLSAEYNRAVSRLGVGRPFWEAWLVFAQNLQMQMEALSPVFYQKSLTFALSPQTRPEPPHTFPVSPAELEARVTVNLEQGPSSRPGQHLGPAAEHEFETFVRGAQKDGVQVFIYLLPFHPLFRSRLNGTAGGKFLDDSEAYYRALARDLSIPLVGSFDLNQTDCRDNEFLDGMHPVGSCVTRVWLEARAQGIVP